MKTVFIELSFMVALLMMILIMATALYRFFSMYVDNEILKALVVVPISLFGGVLIGKIERRLWYLISDNPPREEEK